ncbi:hypothetical protein Vafri_14942 [Volvox africanus]|uniref:Protein kinase domain-containing protein n=1 Tax=Volvox africanus TaxID=51714 RepID=A0A8J4BGK7_9CHLO|nr:hypothetical protein Vafri_14942 [Volvox africanus]
MDNDTLKLKVGRLLGQGAFATVHKAYHNSSVVAVKVLRPERSNNPVAIRLLLREAALASSLSHPNIVRCRAACRVALGPHPPTHGVVMEYMEAGSLADLLCKQMKQHREQLYTELEGLTWLLQIADALSYLHQQDPAIIHRDVKPANVLLAPATAANQGMAGTQMSGSHKARLLAKLCDFGLHQVVKPADHRPLIRVHSAVARASASGLFQNPRISEEGSLLLPAALLKTCERVMLGPTVTAPPPAGAAVTTAPCGHGDESTGRYDVDSYDGAVLSCEDVSAGHDSVRHTAPPPGLFTALVTRTSSYVTDIPPTPHSALPRLRHSCKRSLAGGLGAGSTVTDPTAAATATSGALANGVLGAAVVAADVQAAGTITSTLSSGASTVAAMLLYGTPSQRARQMAAALAGSTTSGASAGLRFQELRIAGSSPAEKLCQRQSTKDCDVDNNYNDGGGGCCGGSGGVPEHLNPTLCGAAKGAGGGGEADGSAQQTPTAAVVDLQMIAPASATTAASASWPIRYPNRQGSLKRQESPTLDGRSCPWPDSVASDSVHVETLACVSVGGDAAVLAAASGGASIVTVNVRRPVTAGGGLAFSSDRSAGALRHGSATADATGAAADIRRRPSLDQHLRTYSFGVYARGGGDSGGGGGVGTARSLQTDMGPDTSLLERVFNFSGQCGSSIYMSPEVAMEQPYNEKADVFSFGVMCFEVLSRRLIGITREGRNGHAFTRMMVEGRRPALPPALNPRVASLIRACWHSDPLERPAMQQVVSELQYVLYGDNTPAIVATPPQGALRTAYSLLSTTSGSLFCAGTKEESSSMVLHGRTLAGVGDGGGGGGSRLTCAAGATAAALQSWRRTYGKRISLDLSTSPHQPPVHISLPGFMSTGVNTCSTTAGGGGGDDNGGANDDLPAYQSFIGATPASGVLHGTATRRQQHLSVLDAGQRPQLQPAEVHKFPLSPVSSLLYGTVAHSARGHGVLGEEYVGQLGGDSADGGCSAAAAAGAAGPVSHRSVAAAPASHERCNSACRLQVGRRVDSGRQAAAAAIAAVAAAAAAKHTCAAVPVCIGSAAAAASAGGSGTASPNERAVRPDEQETMSLESPRRVFAVSSGPGRGGGAAAAAAAAAGSFSGCPERLLPLPLSPPLTSDIATRNREDASAMAVTAAAATAATATAMARPRAAAPRSPGRRSSFADSGGKWSGDEKDESPGVLPKQSSRQPRCCIIC